MAVQSNLPADVVGLTKTAPLSRRGFMTASAASAAGYTLAAGPVRAQVVTTDTSGLTVGEAKVTVAGGEMPGLLRQAGQRAEPAGDPDRHGDLRAARVHQGRDAAARQARRVCRGARLLFPQGRGPHQDHRDRPSCCRSSTPSRTRSWSPTSMPRRPGPRRRAAIPIVWASSASAAAGAPCGSIRRSSANLKAGVAFYGPLVDPAGAEGRSGPRARPTSRRT